jgi:hypothetical protein
MAGAPQATPGVPRRMIGKSAFICSECVRNYYQLMTAAEVTQNQAALSSGRSGSEVS